MYINSNLKSLAESRLENFKRNHSVLIQKYFSKQIDSLMMYANKPIIRILNSGFTCSGKTTMTEGFVGEKILPTSNLMQTRNITHIINENRGDYQLQYIDDNQQPVNIMGAENILEATDQLDENNRSLDNTKVLNIRGKIKIFEDCEYLAGAIIVDTPGLLGNSDKSKLESKIGDDEKIKKIHQKQMMGFGKLKPYEFDYAFVIVNINKTDDMKENEVLLNYLNQSFFEKLKTNTGIYVLINKFSNNLKQKRDNDQKIIKVVKEKFQNYLNEENIFIIDAAELFAGNFFWNENVLLARKSEILEPKVINYKLTKKSRDEDKEFMTCGINEFKKSFYPKVEMDCERIVNEGFDRLEQRANNLRKPFSSLKPSQKEVYLKAIEEVELKLSPNIDLINKIFQKTNLDLLKLANDIIENREKKDRLEKIVQEYSSLFVSFEENMTKEILKVKAKLKSELNSILLDIFDEVENEMSKSLQEKLKKIKDEKFNEWLCIGGEFGGVFLMGLSIGGFIFAGYRYYKAWELVKTTTTFAAFLAGGPVGWIGFAGGAALSFAGSWFLNDYMSKKKEESERLRNKYLNELKEQVGMLSESTTNILEKMKNEYVNYCVDCLKDIKYIVQAL